MIQISIKVPNKLLNLRREFQQSIQESLAENADILSAFTARSIRQRWFDTGKSLGAFRKFFRLRQRFSGVTSGTFYDVFGEYGTGRRGQASSAYHPQGWTYGKLAGMAARRPFGKALTEASPAMQAATKRRFDKVFG